MSKVIISLATLTLSSFAICSSAEALESVQIRSQFLQPSNYQIVKAEYVVYTFEHRQSHVPSPDEMDTYRRSKQVLGDAHISGNSFDRIHGEYILSFPKSFNPASAPTEAEFRKTLESLGFSPEQARLAARDEFSKERNHKAISAKLEGFYRQSFVDKSKMRAEVEQQMRAIGSIHDQVFAAGQLGIAAQENPLLNDRRDEMFAFLDRERTELRLKIHAAKPEEKSRLAMDIASITRIRVHFDYEEAAGFTRDGAANSLK